MTTSDATASLDVAELMAGALQGDQRAWNAIVTRYQSLVISVLRRYRLSEADVQDASQMLWLKLVENLGRVREPAALPGWIVTTTQREALRLINSRRRLVSVDCLESFLGAELPQVDFAGVDADLLRAEETRIVRDGLGELKTEQREFLCLLVAEPPLPYKEISNRLNIPTGGIGPTRARHLKKLRETTAIRSYEESLAG